MKNVEQWKPSKFVFSRGCLRASRDPREVSASSRLITDRIAALYGEHIPQYVRGRLIDLGCGKVPLFEAYRPHITENVCVDWANTMHKNPYLDLECDLAQPLPFVADEFDTIILSDVLEHIPQPELLWAEMRRILKTGGKILLNVPFYYWLHEVPYDFYRYTEYALKRFAQQAGFRILVLQTVGGVPEILADILAKSLVAIPRIGRSMANVVQNIASAVINTPSGRNFSKKSGTKFPLGYFVVAEKLPPAQP